MGVIAQITDYGGYTAPHHTAEKDYTCATDAAAIQLPNQSENHLHFELLGHFVETDIDLWVRVPNM